MLEIPAFRKKALGLYVILNTHSKRVFGKNVENLNYEEFRQLVSQVMPGQERILENIFFSTIPQQETESSTYSKQALVEELVERDKGSQKIVLFI